MKTIYRVLVCAALFGALAFAQRVPSQFPRTVTAVIADGGSLSTAVNFQGCTVARMVVSTLASSAVLTFQGSQEGGTFREIVDFFNTAVTFPASTGDLDIVMPPSDWYARSYVKVRSGTAASPVTQAGGAWITFICKD